MKKRFLSFFVAIMMLIATLPLSSITASAAKTYTGTFGGVNYSMDMDSGTLTFTKGTATDEYAAGEMQTFTYVPTYFRFSFSFDADEVTKVVIEEGVTNIGSYVFSNMPNLVEVEFSSTVKEIGIYAFQNCTNLKTLNFSEGLKKISAYAFQGCTNLETVTFKEGLEEIGYRAFFNCTNLRNIAYPASVKNVASETLSNTAFLTERNISYDCDGDVEYTVCGNTLVYCKTNTLQKTYKIPDGIYCIASDALNKSGSSTVSIYELYTNEVKYISDSVGRQNTTFKAIYLENVEELGSAFGKCKMGSVHFYEGLKSLGSAFVNGSYGAFGTVYCSSSNRIFPSTLEYISSHVFADCYGSQIHSLKIEADEAGIPLYINDILFGVFSTNYVFEDTFVIKEGTRVVADDAFLWATDRSGNGSYQNVTTLEIPSSIITMDDVSVFPNLTDIYYAGSRNDWKAINHLGTYDGITIHYGSDCVEHNYQAVVTKPTCTTDGYTTYTCTECGDTYVGNPVKASHSYGAYKTTKKATTSSNGTQTAVCTACGTEKTKTIKRIGNIDLSTTTYAYNGKVKTPSVIVTDYKGNKLTKGTDYTVAYSSGRKNVGKYAVKITFKGKYSGSKTLYFKINPKATTISKLTRGNKQFTVKWNKQSAQATGYEIRYSTSSSMSNAKTVRITSYKTTSKTIKNLKTHQKYYVQIRTYKTVKGTKYYSSWSTKSTVTTKL